MNIASKTVCASVLFLLAFTLMFTLSSHNVHASPVVLPIINQNEFQSCFFGFCTPSSPAFLFTDVNFTFANYSYISVYSNFTNSSNYSAYANQSQFCYFVNNETERVDFLNTANDSYYLASNPNGYITGYVETDPYYFSNPYDYLNDSSILNVNNSNTSQYCFNILGSTYCYNVSYNPFITPKTCSDTFGSPCNSATLDDSFKGAEGLNGTQINGCNGTQMPQDSSWPYVSEVYINASSFIYGDGINVTCEFIQNVGGFTYFEYVWYYNSSNWINVQNWTNATDFGTTPINRSVAFNLNSSEGTHIVRCILSFNQSSNSNQGRIPNECANTTYSDFYDNDDLNFTVSETDTGNITYETCIDSIQNITANNSLNLGGYSSDYFYPYSNPLGFINSSTVNASWNESYADTKYIPYTGAIDNVDLGSKNITSLGYLGSTGNRIAKGWFTDLESTNAIVGGLIPLSASSGTLIKNFAGTTIASFGLGGAGSTNIIFAGTTVNTGNFTASYYFGNFHGYVSNDTERSLFSSIYNSTYDAKINNPLTANLNTSSYNITVYLSSASVPTCSKYYNVSTLLWCDCFNSTHKWMANTC